ncbi:MAG: type IV pilin protein, partial [Gammaproteobacteria bacterium]
MPIHPGRGFSLTEMLIVVAILGMIAAVVVPSFHSA